MIHCMKVAPILEYENLISIVLCYLIYRNFHFSPLGNVCLRHVKHLAAWLTICTMLPAKPGFITIKVDVGE